MIRTAARVHLRNLTSSEADPKRVHTVRFPLCEILEQAELVPSDRGRPVVAGGCPAAQGCEGALRAAGNVPCLGAAERRGGLVPLH